METEKVKEETKEIETSHRPEKLEAEVVRFQNNHEKWIAVVGLLAGRPYEIFTGYADDFWIPQGVEKGWIVKMRPDGKNSRYDFQFEDSQSYTITIEGLSRAFSKDYWDFAKLVSRMLRQGLPPVFVIKILSKLDSRLDSINVWKNGVKRALTKFIPDGTKVKHPCPICKEIYSMVYQENSLVCKKCGYVERD